MRALKKLERGRVDCKFDNLSIITQKTILPRAVRLVIRLGTLYLFHEDSDGVWRTQWNMTDRISLEDFLALG